VVLSHPSPVLVGVVGQRERRGTGGLVFLRVVEADAVGEGGRGAVLPGTVHDDGCHVVQGIGCAGIVVFPLHQVETHFATAFQVGVAAVVGGDSEQSAPPDRVGDVVHDLLGGDVADHAPGARGVDVGKAVGTVHRRR